MKEIKQCNLEYEKKYLRWLELQNFLYFLKLQDNISEELYEKMVNNLFEFKP